jgi:hypothetical protein
MSKRKLNQVVAIEKGTKSRTIADVTKLHRLSDKPSLFLGHSKRYVPLDDSSERFPNDTCRVQSDAKDVLKQAAKSLTELFDVTAAKDWANCEAKADLVVDGRALLSGVPVTYLLFLEKKLADVRTLVSEMPTLDEAYDWIPDDGSGNFRTRDEQVTHRTKKVLKVLTLAVATDKHPAQAKEFSDDVVVGHWHTVNFSGALPVPRKTELLERVEKLLHAVKFAREEANSVEAEERRVGDAVFGYLFAK